MKPCLCAAPSGLYINCSEGVSYKNYTALTRVRSSGVVIYLFHLQDVVNRLESLAPAISHPIYTTNCFYALEIS